MNDYTPNSHKYRAEQQQEKPKQEKIVTGTVKTKKKSGVSKLADIFIAEDISNVKSYIVTDVLIPAAKKAVSDIFHNGVDMILYGESGRGKKGNSGYVSYRDYSRDDRSSRSESRTRAIYSTDDIILETRGEAEDVLTRMDELIDTYGKVSVADMYDLVGKSCNYTDNNYGWRNLANAEPVRVREGWMLKMPKVTTIK